MIYLFYIVIMIFLLTLWTMMWKIATAEEMILEDVGAWGEKMAEKYPIFNGLIVCQWCIPNIHGIFFVYPLAFGMEILPFVWDYKYLLMYPFALGGASLCSGLIWQYYLTTNRKSEYYEWGAKYYENVQKHYYYLNKKIKHDEKAIEGDSQKKHKS